jgi:hypothetical protein
MLEFDQTTTNLPVNQEESTMAQTLKEKLATIIPKIRDER